MKITQAVILAAGAGVRLKPLTDNTPKPMVPINNLPFLSYQLNELKSNGIKNILLILAHKAKHFTNYYGSGKQLGLDISYSIEDLSLPSASRLEIVKPLLDDHFLLTYGDIYWPFNLEHMAKSFLRSRLPYQITAYNNQDGWGEYGFENNLYVDKHHRVINYDRSRSDSQLNCLDIGFLILNKSITDHITKAPSCLCRDLLPTITAKGQLSAYRTDTRYYTITNEKMLRQTAKLLKSQSATSTDHIPSI